MKTLALCCVLVYTCCITFEDTFAKEVHVSEVLSQNSQAASASFGAASLSKSKGKNRPPPKHKEFSWRCYSKGHKYKPNSNTTCVCVEILQAVCTPDNAPTTTTLSPGGTPVTSGSSTTPSGTASTITTSTGGTTATSGSSTTPSGTASTATSGSEGTTVTSSSSTTPSGTASTTTMPGSGGSSTTVSSGTTSATSPTTPSSTTSGTGGTAEPSGATETTISTTTTAVPTTTSGPIVVMHPLDPLTPDEISQTKTIINQQRVRQETRYIFNYITLQEPPKSVLLPYFLSNTDPPVNVAPRKSFSIIIERGAGNASEVVVNLDTDTIESVTPVPDGQMPSLSPEDMLNSEEIAKADSTVQARCAALGYPNMSLVSADPWTIGYIADKKNDPAFQSRRIIQLYFYGRNFEGDNHYAHPFDFLVLVDAVEGKVVRIEDLPTHDDFNAANKEGNTVPRESHNYDFRYKDAGFLRTDDKPITVSSPQGPSYKVTGNQIEWQKFKMRLGFNGREGLVIYNVNYKDGQKVRPIMYRASLSEMFIPYGDPRPPYHRKAVFDLGEYGIGFNANELKPNQDCIGEVKYFDGILNNSTGDPITYKNAICVREEDAGILWKHVDYRTAKGVVVRSHRLVLSFIATVGNYEYIFLWSFYQDGSIQLQIQMTGILSINLLAVGASAAGYGTVEAPQINAQFHQHFFAVRLDTEIDGNNNSVYTSEAVPVPEPTGSAKNPYGQGFTTLKTDLKTAAQARTNFSAETGRVWAVSNPNVTHPYTKHPVAWKLMPMNTPGLKMREDSPLRPKAAFLDYDVWVTPYEENQFFAGGYYLNNSGLPEWVGNNPDASVDNTDIVLWHNFGLTHIPRVEDYPVMPVESTGFWFKPYNFFSENPGLDVPPPSATLRKTEL